MDWFNVAIISIMAIILVLIFTFIISKAVDLFSNPGED